MLALYQWNMQNQISLVLMDDVKKKTLLNVRLGRRSLCVYAYNKIVGESVMRKMWMGYGVGSFLCIYNCEKGEWMYV